MSKILDLSVFKVEPFEIKMPDGHYLHINKPSQKMVIALMAFREEVMDNDPEKALTALNESAKLILNSNTDAVTYSDDTIDDMPIQMKTAIISEYTKYIAGIQDNPN